MVSGIDASADNGAHVTGRRYQARAYVAIFSSLPSLPPDVPRTPGIRQTETQPAVSRHPAAEIPGLSRGHLSRGHTRTASARPGRVLRLKGTS